MLPVWREKFSPDVVIANVENIAHGKGIGMKQIQELKDAGVDIFTGGNHSLEGKDFAKVLDNETLPITRPANMPEGTPGRGAILYDLKNGMKLLVINLIGQVFMNRDYDSPFHTVDKILEKYSSETQYKILDWHADATSEKTVMGWYLDGKVSAVFGTHTHVPTLDAKILPKGTAYISDIGMVGPHNSVIGVEIEPAIKKFINNEKKSMGPVESGPIEVNAIFLELSDEEKPARRRGAAVDIRHLREIISNIE